jgi:hypothetical protein
MTAKTDNKIVYIQGVVTQSDLDRLKEKTGEQFTKDAVRVAIEAYLNKGE